MPSYSNEMKESLVARLCVPGGPSALQLSKDTGISQTALSRWKKQHGNKSTLKNRRSTDWTAEAKLQAVIEAQGLNDEELGAFLRKNGLHSTELDEWKKEIVGIVNASAKKTQGRPRKDPELTAAEEEIKRLKRDLRRKEKALAEQTAIVILQKKAQILWGTDGDDE